MSFIKYEDETQTSIDLSGEDEVYEKSNIEEDEQLLEANTGTQNTEIFYTKPSLNLLDGVFFQYIPEKSTNNKLVAYCMKCAPLPVEVKGYGSCTSNFISHLKRRHGNETVEEYRDYMKSKKKRVSQSPRNTNVNRMVFGQEQIMHDYPTSSFNMQDLAMKRIRLDEKPLIAPITPTVKYTSTVFSENLFNFFSSTLIPTNVIEDPYFTKLLTNLNLPPEDLETLKCQNLEQQINQRFKLHRNYAINELQEMQYTGITIHIWSGEKVNFIGLVVHWLTSNLNRKSVVLAVRVLEEKNLYIHETGFMNEQMQNIFADFGLLISKLRDIVIGLNEDYVKDYQTLGVEPANVLYEKAITVENSIMCNETSILKENAITYPTSLTCPVNLLNKAMKESFVQTFTEQHKDLTDIHNSAIAKCNLLWKAAGDINKATIIQNVLHYNLDRPHSENWRSLYNALKQISGLVNNSQQLYEALELSNPINSSEFYYIQEFLRCTAPIMEALDILQAESNSYFGILLPCLFALKRNLKKANKPLNLIYCQPLLDNFLENISKVFQEYFELKTERSQNAAIAALSYPRFKNQWLLCCVEQKQQFEILNFFKLAISKYTKVKPIIKNEAAEENKALAFFDFGEDLVEDAEVKNPKNQLEINLNNTVEAQVLHFFAEESKDISLLDQYLEIKKVFIEYNTPLPSSALAKKLFDKATMNALLNDPKKFNSLLEKRLILNTNLKMN